MCVASTHSDQAASLCDRHPPRRVQENNMRRPKILAALAAVALSIALTGVSSGGPLATAVTPGPSAVAASAFSAAAAKYGVPESVLLAVSYAETRWDDHPGAPS